MADSLVDDRGSSVQALKEIHRVLKPGGRAAFIAWPMERNLYFLTALGPFVKCVGQSRHHHRVRRRPSNTLRQGRWRRISGWQALSRFVKKHEQ